MSDVGWLYRAGLSDGEDGTDGTGKRDNVKI